MLLLFGCVAVRYPAGVDSSADLVASDGDDARTRVHLAAQALCLSADRDVAEEDAAARLADALQRLLVEVDGLERAEDARALGGAGDALAGTDATVRHIYARQIRPERFVGCDAALEAVGQARAQVDAARERVEEATRAWREVEASWVEADVRAYAEAHPGSPHAGDAGRRLDEIRAEGAAATALEAEVLAAGPTACGRPELSARWRSPAAVAAVDRARAACHRWLAAEDELRALAAEPLDGAAHLPEAALASIVDEAPSLASHVQAERLRRLRALAACTPGPAPKAPANPYWFVSLAPTDRYDTAEGFADPRAAVTLWEPCGAQDGAPRWLGEVDGFPALLRPIAFDPAAAQLGLALGDLEPCSYAEPSFVTGRRAGATMIFEVHRASSDPTLAANVSSALTVPLGLGAVRESDVLDQDLVDEAFCRLEQLRDALGADAEPPATVAIPDTPDGLVLWDALPAAPSADRLWDGVAAVQLDVVLELPTEVVDAYGVRRPGTPKRLRTGRFRLTAERFFRNDWESIAELVGAESLLLRNAQARAVLRRYVTSFETW